MKKLTDEQVKDIEEILELGEKSIETKVPVVRGNKEAAQILGKAIGGDEGEKIAACGATSSGIAAVMPTGVFIGYGVAVGAMALPAAVPIITMAYLLHKVFSSDEEKYKSYAMELEKRMRKLQEQVEAMQKELDRTRKDKYDIVRDLKEKIAERELIIMAMAKKLEELKSC